MQVKLAIVVLALVLVVSAFGAGNAFDNGIRASNQKKFDQAISLFSEEIRQHPGNGAAYNNRGLAYLEKGALDLAIADFNVPIRLRPNYYPAYSNRALAYQRKEEHEKAVADFSQAIRLRPGNADDYNNRGASFASLKR
jgi:tetratricopeptide (TPR) repeat protein